MINKENYFTYFKFFLKKGNRTKIKLLLLVLISITLSTLLESLIYNNIYGYFSFDRVLLITLFIYFLGIHCILKIKNMYNFIYRKRYFLAGILLLFIIIMGYSGSSIILLDNVVQPNCSDNDYKPIFGKAREIRGDEWTTNTLLAFSQNKSEERLPYFTLKVRGTSTDMFTIINAPVADIVSVGKPFNIGYIFDNEVGLSFQWYARLIALLLSSFELCMLISKKNKMISLVGSLLITFSPAVQWWYSNFLVDILIIGNIAIVLIDKFMTTKKKYVKYICMAVLSVLAVSYIFVFYPAWQIPFAYVYLALFIYIIIKNKKEYKFCISDLIAIIIAILFVGLILFRYFALSKDTLEVLLNTDYPGSRFELGGEGAKVLFSYMYSMFFPFSDTSNPCEYSSMLSFFPMILIMSVIYVIRNEQRKTHYSFLIPIWIVSAILTLFSLVETNSIFAKMTFLYMCPAVRVVIPLGFAQILMLIYILGSITFKDKLLSKKNSIIFSIGITSILMYIAIKTAPTNYVGSLKSYISGIFYIVLYYFLFSANDEKNKKILCLLLSILAIISGGFVNPIIKGVDVIYEKPLSREIAKIVENDENAIWIVDNTFIIPNYLAANGARTINTTNYYPNFELINTIFGEEYASCENIRKIYNRYAHIFINLTEEESDINLIQMDTYKINLNLNKLKDLDVKYVYSIRELEQYNNLSINFEKVYYEDGCYIYKLTY